MVRSRFNYKNIKHNFTCFLNLFKEVPLFFYIDFDTSYTFKPWDFLTFKNLNKFLIKRPLLFKQLKPKKIFFLKKFFNFNNIFVNFIKF